MSYQVFARKWRPQSFDEIVGQEHITQTLKNSIQSGKIAHAYLFSGPRGVGKTSCARIFAKSLNCQEAPTINPCGKCSACNEITEGRSLDVIEIDGASNRGIDEIRTLRENVKFSPVLGKYKIYIIDEVHMLTQDAFNALLKTLEEPPEHVKFIFATTHPNKVLPTILSRCQRFEFNRISTLKIISQLEKICKAEGISIDKDVLFDIAKISDGSMRDAESVLDQLVSFSKNNIKSGDVIEAMGLIEQDSYFNFVKALKDNDAQFCIDFISKLFIRGKNIDKFLEGLLWHLRNMMLAKIAKSNLEELLDLPDNIIEKVSEQCKSMSLQEIIDIFSAVMSAQDMAKKIGSFRIPLEVMVVKLTSQGISDKPSLNLDKTVYKQQADPGETESPSKTKSNNFSAFLSRSRKETSKDEISKKDASAKLAMEASDDKIDKDNDTDNASLLQLSSAASVDFNTVSGSWPQLVDVVAKAKMSVATYLKDARPMSLENRVLTIGFPKQSVFYKEAIEERHNQKLITDKFKEMFNTMISLKFELVEELSKENPAMEVHSEFIESALDTFGGRLFQGN